MKQVFEQYASALIASLLATILFSFVFSGTHFGEYGITEVLSKMVNYSVNSQSVEENKAFTQFMRESSPVITSKEGKLVIADHEINLSDYYEARSFLGELLPVTCVQVWNLEGRVADVLVSDDRTTLCIPTHGVYWIEISAMDKNGKKTNKIAKFLVNER